MVRQLGNQYVSTLGEEIANLISHGVMTVLALAAVPFVAVWGFTQYGMVEAVSLSIYATCLFLMFAVSTLYHSLNEGKAKDIFHLLDRLLNIHQHGHVHLCQQSRASVILLLR